MGFWGFWGTKIENSPGSTSPKNHFEPVDHSDPSAAIGDGPGSSPGPVRALWMAQGGTGTLGIAPFNRQTSGTRSCFWTKYKDRSPGSKNDNLGGKPGSSPRLGTQPWFLSIGQLATLTLSVSSC
jgi:hypothetical protein